MKKRGRMVYVPGCVLGELEDLKKEHCLKKRKEAFDKFVNYAQVGREAERLITGKNLFWRSRK